MRKAIALIMLLLAAQASAQTTNTATIAVRLPAPGAENRALIEGVDKAYTTKLMTRLLLSGKGQSEAMLLTLYLAELVDLPTTRTMTVTLDDGTIGPRTVDTYAAWYILCTDYAKTQLDEQAVIDVPGYTPNWPVMLRTTGLHLSSQYLAALSVHFGAPVGRE